MKKESCGQYYEHQLRDMAPNRFNVPVPVPVRGPSLRIFEIGQCFAYVRMDERMSACVHECSYTV